MPLPARPVISVSLPAARHAPREFDFVFDALVVDIIGLALLVERQQAVATDLDQSLGCGGQADDHGVLQFEQLGWGRALYDQRDVGNLVAAIGEVDAGRRFRAARHAREENVGLFPFLPADPVVMRDGELDGLDAIEIGLVHRVLAAGPTMCFLAERLFQRFGHPVEDRHCGKTQLAASFFQARAGFRIDQREQHEARIALEFGQNPFEVLAAANHRPEMAHDVGILELRERRLGEHLERFTGGIGEQMEMDAIGDRRAPQPVENGWHKPREKAGDKFGNRNAPRYESFAGRFPHSKSDFSAGVGTAGISLTRLMAGGESRSRQ